MTAPGLMSYCVKLFAPPTDRTPELTFRRPPTVVLTVKVRLGVAMPPTYAEAGPL